MRPGLSLLLALGVLWLPAPALANWPIYGHDLSNSRDAGADGPAPSQVGSLSQAWAFNSPTGDFTGTPVVADGVLVAGDQGGHIYAFDAVTGKVLWTKDAGAPINGSAAIDVAAPGGPTAFVPVAEIGRPRLLAFSLHDGAKRWEAVLSTQPGASVFGSGVYWKGLLYIGTSGPNNDNSHARGSVVALDEASGATRWQTFTVPPGSDGAAVWSTPAIDPATGRLYVGTGNNYHQPTTDTEDAVLALDAASGRILAHFQATAGDTFAADNPAGPDYDFGASPNLVEGPNGQALVGEGQKSGVYWMLDRQTLQPMWSTTVGPGGILGGILGSTAYDGTHIFGADTINGQVFALARSGSISWQSQDSGAHLSAASIAHGVLYTVDPAGFLTARDPATGTMLSKLPLGGPSFGGVSAVGGAVYVAVGTGPPPEPAPQSDGTGSIVAFGDTSHSGGSGSGRPPGPGSPAGRGRKPRIRVSVRPRTVRAERRTRLRFHTKVGSRPLAGATIHVAGRVVRTDRHGHATASLRFRRPGMYVVRVTHRGLQSRRATIRVISPSPRAERAR
jgi:polyvinyl alcohol dehydrogenase (cytochrome)